MPTAASGIEACGADYDEKRYTMETKDEWFEKDKPELLKESPFANITGVVLSRHWLFSSTTFNCSKVSALTG